MAQRKVTAAQIEVSTLESSLTQLTGLTGGISTPDFISFDTAAAAPSAVGRLFWDDGTGTLKLGLKGGNVDVDIGQTLVELCFQNTGTTIAKGKVVYISGAQGNRIKVDLADNTSDTTSARTLGIVAESFPDGTEKFVITQGIIKNVDTSAYTPGTILWLGTSGNVTSTKPVAPNHLVFVGVVIKQNASSGEIYVKVQNGYELDEIHDVKITTPITDNSVLMYDTTQSVWENIAPTTAFNTLSPLTTKGDILTNDGTNDARLAVGTNGYVLSADSAEPTGLKWIAAGGGSGTVTSVDVSGGTTGLTFSGGPVTTSGTITMAGTLDETNGGTNQTTYATGDLLYASASNTLSKLTIGTTGQVLTVSGGAPTWAAAPSGGGESFSPFLLMGA